MAAAISAGVMYAPEDPTLPKPWKGLVDGKTGYLYFWNPETNVTQYERPASSSLPVQRPSHVYNDSSSKDDDDRFTRVGNGGSVKVSSGVGISQGSCSGPDLDVQKMAVGAGVTNGYLPSVAGNSLSAESYRKRHEISVTGVDVPPPLISFDSTGFPSEILREVKNAGFSAPTPIQAQSWPIALQGRDIVAIAKTGSGKTLGYLLPGFIHLKHRHNNPQLGPTVLVLSPTRELATQIQEEAMKFGRSSRICCTCLYGGAPKGPQLRELDRGTDIVVATPGRLNDILEMRRISLHQVSYLVLDEADRMLDMGFEPQISKIVKEVPTQRQTLMYTATWPKEVRKIASDLLVKPVQVNIGNVDELVANKSITQHIELLSPMDKQRRVEQILRSQEPGSKIIIFCSTKKMCDLLARNLTRQFRAAAIHGDKSQSDRDFVLNQFRSGRSPVLVATDVAGRGLDIKDIRAVINYDFPTGIEDYVHRIGRTGRAGATGVAYTFFGDQDSKHASDLVKLLEGANQRVPRELRDLASRGGGMGRSRRWGPGPGGHDGGRGGRYDSDYNGRDVGRGRWSNYSSKRGGRRSYDRDSNDSDRYGRSSHDEIPRSYHQHRNPETMSLKQGRSRSRSRSPYRGSRWGNNSNSRSRSRSRSPDRFGLGPLARSFHEAMIQRPRPPPKFDTIDLVSFNGSNSVDNFGGSSNEDRQQWRTSPVKQQENGDDRVKSRVREEEEEEGMIQPEEGNGSSAF